MDCTWIALGELLVRMLWAVGTLALGTILVFLLVVLWGS